MNDVRWFRWIGLPLALLLPGLVLFRVVSQLGTIGDLNHTTGIWMSLAEHLDRGSFYPPLERDGFYAGTRYMPVVFITTSFLGSFTQSYLIATKLTALFWSLALLSLLFVMTRRIVGSNAEAFVLTIALLSMPEIRMALFAPHQEAPSVACTLAGLLIISRNVSHRTIIMASFFFACAFLAKWSALVGPATAFVWLIATRWRAALQLALGTGSFIALGVLLLQWGSDGRFLENMRALGSGGMTRESIILAPSRLVYLLTRNDFARPLLFGVALLIVCWKVTKRDVGIIDCYFLVAMASLLVIMTSPGTEWNHLVEPEVAALLLLVGMRRSGSVSVPLASALRGEGWGEGSSASPHTTEILDPPLTPALSPQSRSEGVGGSLRVVFIVLIALGIFSVVSAKVSPDMTESEVKSAFANDPHLLSEDVTVLVLTGERPTVMDAFNYRILAAKGIVDPQLLVDRIAAHEFDALVFRFHPERAGALCPRFHFGPLVTDSMLKHYHHTRDIGPWVVYTPKP